MSGPLTNGWPSKVNANQAPALEGDFVGINPRAFVLGNPGGFLAPVGGAIVGRFVWVDTDTGAVSQAYVPGRQLAFLHREEGQTLITAFLGGSTYAVLQGLPLALFVQGDFWGRFAAGATPGQNVFADPSTGQLIAATGATAATGTSTASAGAAFTGQVTTNVLTVSAVTAGVVRAGDTILTGAGFTVGTVIGAQLSGTPGGAGTYTFVHANVGPVAVTTASTNLDLTAVLTGTPGVGSLLSGTNVTAGTYITAQQSGTPNGIGVYTLSVAQQFASTTVTENGILTPWKVNSLAANGELAKISTWG